MTVEDRIHPSGPARLRLWRPLIGTIVYASILTILLVMPAAGTHVRRGYLRETNLRFAWRTVVDIVGNFAVFVPLGWGLHRVTRRWRVFPRAVDFVAVSIAVAVFSLTMETVQYFLPSRYSSFIDVITNSLGGAVGAWLEGRAKDTS
jgi:VanZ family protein